MNINPPQIDEYIPTKYMRYIGGFKTIANRATFYFSFPQFLMIAVLIYNDMPFLQSIFPNIWTWMAFLGLLMGIAIVVEYGLVLPSEITFQMGQNSRENRNPTYARVCENSRELEEIKELLEERD